MVHKKEINQIFDLIIKKYDTINKCQPVYEEFTYTTLSGREVTIEVETMHQRPSFKKAVDKVIEDYKKKGFENKIWRVDSPDLDWIKGAKMYRTRNGSTIAIRPDGDIVAVTGKLGDDGYALDNSETMMAFAVSKGGTKLDSFDGNWAFYRKCGFEPLSYISFNEEYAPPLWVKGRDKSEPVIFMTYTGDKVKLGSQEASNEQSKFYTNTKETTMDNAIEGEESAWDVAYRIRDETM